MFDERFNNLNATNEISEANQPRDNYGQKEDLKDKSDELTKADFDRISSENDLLMRELVKYIKEGPRSRRAQQLIERHYQNLKYFYEPTPALYRGLANLYIQDDRFARYFENFHPKLPRFMHDAMIAFCEGYETHA